FEVLPFIRKRGGVLKYKNRTISYGKALCSCLKMPTQNVLLVDAIVVDETIGCLGASWNSLPSSSCSSHALSSTCRFLTIHRARHS
ncbi:hypothetical protein, partial [Paraburkholderia caribensis]